MTRGKLLIAAIVLLVVAFVSGFVLRPVISPKQHAETSAATRSAASISSEARATQYFMAHIDEARRVVTACREGSVVGEECTNAETAVITVESEERFKRFRSNK